MRVWQASAITLMLATSALLGGLFMVPPAAATTGQFTVKVTGPGVSYTSTMTADIQASYSRFAVATLGRSLCCSNEGQVAISNLVVTKSDGTTQTINLGSATVIESAQGSTVQTIRLDPANNRVLGIGNSLNSRAENYQSIAIPSTAVKMTFTFDRITGDVGDGNFWDLHVGFIPSDNEAVGPTSNFFGNLLGLHICGDGDGARLCLSGYASGTQDSNQATYQLNQNYNVEIDLPNTDPCAGPNPPSSCNPCSTPVTNAPPSTPSITADGMGDGSYGWVGSDFSYAFSTSSTDPDGDPITYTWNFGDGKTGAGADVDHAFASAGAKKVTVTAKDDPSARNAAQPKCPPAASQSSTSTVFVFTAIDDWSTELVHPTQSCINDLDLGIPAVNVIALSCTLNAAVDTGDAPANLVAKVCYWVDGVATKLCATKDPYKQTYDSTKFPVGQHTLQAEAYAKGDKYKRGEAGDFLSDEFAYLNVNA
jgi:hypothetical protein